MGAVPPDPPTRAVLRSTWPEPRSSAPPSLSGPRKPLRRGANGPRLAGRGQGAGCASITTISGGHKKLVELMLPALQDPSPLVRNNATRVLVNVAMFHADIPVPVKPFLKALDGPTMSDRNKAGAVLSGLLERADGSKLHAEVIRDGGPALLRLMALEEPNNHDFAYKILEKLSGKDLGERDLAAWQKWLDEQRNAKGAAGAKPGKK